MAKRNSIFPLIQWPAPNTSSMFRRKRYSILNISTDTNSIVQKQNKKNDFTPLKFRFLGKKLKFVQQYHSWVHLQLLTALFFFKKIEIQCLVCGKLELWNVKSKELPHHFVRKVLSVPLFGVLTDNSINVINFLSLISQNTGYFPCLLFGVWVRNWNLFSNMLFMSACTINFWLYYFFC